MKIRLALLCSIFAVPAFSQSSGIPWRNGDVLTANALQSLDAAKMNLSSLGLPGFAAKLDALGRVTAPVVGDVSKAIATPAGDTVSSIAEKANNAIPATGGTSTNQTVNMPTIMGGTLDGLQTIPGAANNATPRTLLRHFADNPNVIDYGAKGNGTTDDGPSVAAAISAANNGTTVFPYSSSGYYLNTGSFPQTTVGHYALNGNIFSGASVGSPSTGAGLFNSPYTNPWNVTTGDRWHYDPAGYGPQKNNVTFEGQSITCGPNHAVTGDEITNRHWVACVYRGADTGSGGAAGTQINTEVDNDVLNLNTNSGTAYEIDVNVNGSVADGDIQRGIFITGGGNAGNTWNGVALDIQHGTYSGTGSLNWSTGVSVRNSLRAFMASAESDGLGELYLGYDKNGKQIYNVDTKGYVTGAAFTGTASEGLVTNGSAGTWRYMGIQSGGVDRWQVGADATAESGNNSGSDFYISRRTDGGADADHPLTVSRSTGQVTLADGANINGLKLTPHTYATLTTCSSTIGGTMEQVTDSNTNTWGDTVSGGGNNVVIAFCDGSNWTVMAK